MKHINLPPNSSSLVESMRDIGYSIETAIADIIDNSITAKAKEIDIRFHWNSNNPWLAIVDNGHGMDQDELVDAMRFGSISPLEVRDEDDLGRFGLGLKTASFSQCRCLTVISKKNEVISCAKWDLDAIASANNNMWSLGLLSETEIKNCLNLSILEKEYLAHKSSGTIVLWEKIDRMTKEPSNKKSENIFNESISNARIHLELVFHRFLSPSSGESKITISFNKNKLVGFDPFNTSKATELQEEEFLFEGKTIKVQPYVLPHHNKVNKIEWKKYAGKQGYLHEQGFYVYRNRRLIIYATWFRMIRKEELTKLLRVRIDIPNSLDHLWRIDIKKSNAFPPTGVRNKLKQIIYKIENSGKRVYKQRGQRVLSEIKHPAWIRVAKDGQIYYQINKENPLLKQYAKNLTNTQKDRFEDIITMVESTFPRETFFNDVATSPEQMNTISMNRDQIEDLLKMFISIKERPSKSRSHEILQIDPFASNIQITKEVLKELGYEF